MKARALVLFLLIFAGWAAHAVARPIDPTSRAIPAVHDASLMLESTRGPASFKAADPDTFYLYGGPGSLLGKFQTSPGASTADLQGWSSNDGTYQTPLWQPSTFNSPTGTTAMWAGQTAAQQPTWVSAPGYGNSWNEFLTFRQTVIDPSVGQTVDLSFVFNYDAETTWDWFEVRYDLANIEEMVFRATGANKDVNGIFTPVTFPTGSELTDIEYFGNDYSGPNEDEVVIRFAATSDGAWSNADGFWPGQGLAQVDNINVVVDGNPYFEDFEGAPGQFLWQPDQQPYAGNYADIYSRITDIDPCRENPSPLIGFIDHPNPYSAGDPSAAGDADNLLPKNPAWGGAPTSGSTSTTWNYGIPGGWVINYSGGVSAGLLDLQNAWWSPVIDWDDPTTTGDDATDVAGVRIRASIWRHLPLLNAKLYNWGVRSRDASTQDWGPWRDRTLGYYGGTAAWLSLDRVVTDLIEPNSDALQLQLRLIDTAGLIGFPSNDATPSPCFDNVAVLKYRVSGPMIATRPVDLLQDSFAQSGATRTQLATQGERETHGVRLDMARDVNSGENAPNVPGDSIIVDVTSVIPGVAISDSLNQIRLHYALNMNPVFESAIRGNLSATATNATVSDGMYGWDQSVGTVVPQQATTSVGASIGDRYFFDFPDDHFMYPGDVMEYYIEAWDDAGNTTTLPSDLTGYDDEDNAPLPYSRTFTVRALPTYMDTAGDHPATLWWNDFGRRGAEEEWLRALVESQMLEGVQFDSYTTMGPSSLVSNGLGSAGAHGASSAQLDGYSCVLYESGDLTTGLISSGVNAGFDDKGDDTGVLLDWWNSLGSDRNMAHWGDALSLFFFGAGSSSTYLSTILGATFVAADVGPSIGGQTAPVILPTGNVGGFNVEFFANGGCHPSISNEGLPAGLSVRRQFDQLTPAGGAVATHAFEVAGSPGMTYDANTVAAAGIYNTTTDGSGGEKKSFYFPYSLQTIQTPQHKFDPGNLTTRSELLIEVIAALDGSHPGAIEVPVPSAPSLTVHGNIPNPFNPSTELRFTLGQKARGSVKIYNLRGGLVRTAASGEFEAGLNRIEWDGKDAAGREISSGVYLVRYEIGEFEQAQKVLMLK